MAHLQMLYSEWLDQDIVGRIQITDKYNTSSKRESFLDGRKYTPLYKKGIKEIENKSMETTNQKYILKIS